MVKKAMTKADQMRRLRAGGVSVDKIAVRLGVSRQHVQAQFWADDNRARRREHARRWQRDARENPSYYAQELAAMHERYHGDPINREKRLVNSRQWRKRNPTYAKEWRKRNPDKVAAYAEKYRVSQ